jgi:thiamine transport system permease protein
MAGALSVIQLVFTYVFLLLYARIQDTSAIPINFKPRELTTRKNITLQDRFFIFGAALIILAITSPLISLVIRTIFFEGMDSAAQISNLFSNERGSYFHLSPVKIVFNSLRFALCAMFVSLVLGTIVSYSISRSSKRTKSVRDALFMLPLGVSAVTLGFGYIISLSNPPIDIRGSWIILVVAHSLVAYPFVIRSLLPVLQGIAPNLRAAAMVLGADPKRVFISIDLPLITPALIVGATFAFAVSMGEFGASLILVRQEFTTIPVAIFRYLGLPGAENLWNALAMSSLLMVVVALGFIGIERFRYKDLGSF